MRCYITKSLDGERRWWADDYEHAVQQHRDAFPEEVILDVTVGFGSQ